MSSDNTYSQTFEELFDSLPESTQKLIVRQHLVPLLDRVASGKALKILASTRQAVNEHIQAKIPPLLLQEKKIEVNILLEQLSKELQESGPSSRGNGHNHGGGLSFGGRPLILTNVSTGFGVGLGPQGEDFSNPADLMGRDWSKQEILRREMVQSVAEWLNDIWTNAVEYKTEFAKAHACLMFSMGVLDHARGACGCTGGLNGIYIPIIIKDKHGKVIKSSTKLGVQNVEDTIMWICRELMISMLETGESSAIARVPLMLLDMDDFIGWQGLDKMIRGGRNNRPNVRESNNPSLAGADAEDMEDEDEGMYEDDDDAVDVFTADHWTPSMEASYSKLRTMVEDRLIQTYAASPSIFVYNCIMLICQDTQRTREKLLQITAELAIVSSQGMATALVVYGYECMITELKQLLESHSFLLRPRDARELMLAVKTLTMFSPTQQYAYDFASKELMASARAVITAMQPVFPSLNTNAQKTEVDAVVATRSGSTARSERVERWVENASRQPPVPFIVPLNGNNINMNLNAQLPPDFNLNLNPNHDNNDEENEDGDHPNMGLPVDAMALAAMMADMGLPFDAPQMAAAALGVAMGGIPMPSVSFTEIADQFADDPDAHDYFPDPLPLPNGDFVGGAMRSSQLSSGDDGSNGGTVRVMRGRLEKWISITSTMANGSTILLKFYKELLDEYPWLKSHDLVEALSVKMKQKGNKGHVREALAVLLTFCKAQRKKVSDYVKEQRRKARAAAAAAAGDDATAAEASGSNSAPLSPEESPSSPTNSTTDDNSDTPGLISINDVD